jgi:hypothetical protein
MPRRRPSAAKSALPADPSPEERARAAVAKEESLPGEKVRLTFRLVLERRVAEALSARAIREEKNLPALVTEILEAATAHGQRDA